MTSVFDRSFFQERITSSRRVNLSGRKIGKSQVWFYVFWSPWCVAAYCFMKAAMQNKPLYSENLKGTRRKS